MHAHRLQVQVQFKERMFLERGRTGAHCCVVPHQCKQHCFWRGRVWGAMSQAPWALEYSQLASLARRSHINLHDTWYRGWSTNCLSWNNNENKEHAIPGGILLPRLAFDLYNILGQSAGIWRNQITHCVFLSFFFPPLQPFVRKCYKNPSCLSWSLSETADAFDLLCVWHLCMASPFNCLTFACC